MKDFCVNAERRRNINPRIWFFKTSANYPMAMGYSDMGVTI
jgi:hypothetical protein